VSGQCVVNLNLESNSEIDKTLAAHSFIRRSTVFIMMVVPTPFISGTALSLEYQCLPCPMVYNSKQI